RRGSEGRKPMIEIAFHAVVQDDGTIRIAALGISRAGTNIPSIDVLLWIRIDHAWNLGGIDNDDAVLLQDIDRLGHGFSAFGVQAVVKRSTGDADSHSLQAIALEEPCVIAVWGRRASIRGRIVRIGRLAFQ